MSGSTIPRVVRREDGEHIRIGGFETGYRIVGTDGLRGGAAVVEHTVAPFGLAAPLHRDTREDEISHVLTGAIVVQQGDDITSAGPGEYVFKPRGIFHTFWNPGPTPARLIEIIAPAGFELYFRDLRRIVPDDRPPDMDEVVALAGRYGLEFDLGSVPVLLERHGLRFG
jgi:mannose-6-phosphate isomerase-like protein (cupin superfamily)